MSTKEFAKSCLRANVLACQRDLRANCLHANAPKECKFLIFMCQRANKGANVPYAVPMFQTGVPTCQKVYQFFKHSSYEMLEEISILNY